METTEPEAISEWLTLEQAAKHVGLSKSTLERCIRAGCIKVCRIPPLLPRKAEAKKSNRSKFIVRVSTKELARLMRSHESYYVA